MEKGVNMAMNPMEMLKIAKRMNIFSNQHPKTVAFFKNIPPNAVSEGSVIEVRLTDTAGHVYVTNFRVTEQDMETWEIVKKMSPGSK